MNKSLTEKIPADVLWTLKELRNANYEAFIVGGCVRDLLIDKEPNDWDITTNAIPEEIIAVFEATDRRVVYENNFGTVGIINKEQEKTDATYALEITPYRTEGAYSDNRRPDDISFSDDIHEDVMRRDFTINALAYDPISYELIDDFKGQQDLRENIIRTVGNPGERFSEDALRILRAIRFAAQLGFSIEDETKAAIIKHAASLKTISAERIRDEFLKLIDAPHAMNGILMLEELGLLEIIIPELREGIECEQGGIHSYSVCEHLLKSLEHGTHRNYPLHVKIAALFHDIGKPRTRRKSTTVGKKEWTFYGHEVVGAQMSEKIMKRLKFPKDLNEKVTKLVRYHMFFSDPDAITLSAVRRMVANVGEEMIWDLMDLRTCDRIGTGRPKEKPYRLRKYHAMIEEVLRDPVSVGMLKINGDIMIKEMGLKPGRAMGFVLHALLEEVLDDPKLNTREYLEDRARTLYELPEKELQKLGEAGKDKKEAVDFDEVKKLHRKHKVE